jgi:predicted RNA-binding protein with PUA-like domain
MKSEPAVYSIDDMEKDGTEEWEGVRNYQARNFMRDMKEGDLVLFYHSNTKPPGVVGVVEIVGEARPDDTQFDRRSPYFDERVKKGEPRWDVVDVAHVETFDETVPLATLKDTDALEGMLILRKGSRLSVTPVDEKHFEAVLKLAGAKTRVR